MQNSTLRQQRRTSEDAGHTRTTHSCCFSHTALTESAVHWSCPPATHTYTHSLLYMLYMATHRGHNPIIKSHSHLYTSSSPGWVTSVPFLDIQPKLCSCMNTLSFCLVCSHGVQTPNLSCSICSFTCRRDWKKTKKKTDSKTEERKGAWKRTDAPLLDWSCSYKLYWNRPSWSGRALYL